MFIEPRKPVTVDELLRGMVVQSGNDASIALAEAVSGSEDVFVTTQETRDAMDRHDVPYTLLGGVMRLFRPDEDETETAPPVHQASGEQRADEGFWVAVLPFSYTGCDQGVSALAERGVGRQVAVGFDR